MVATSTQASTAGQQMNSPEVAIAMSGVPPSTAAPVQAPAVAKPAGTVPILSLWRFASRQDYFFISVGLLFSAAAGAMQPASILVLGQVLGNFGSVMSAGPGGVSPQQMVDGMIPTILIFVYLGIAMLIGGYVAQCSWVLSGENQAKRIRQFYFYSILRQDLSWFDKADEGSLTTRLALDTQQIQDGISEKAGMAIQCAAQFITGFIVAFVKGWKLALVLLAALPLLGVVGTLMILVISKFTTKGADAYADAGAVAEQVIAGIRTVYAFSMQSRFLKRYENELEKAYISDVRKGQAISLGFASFMCVLFSTYGLAFWYGATLVIANEMDAGQVTVVFFSMLMGAMAFIIIPPNLSAIATARGAAHKIFTIIDRIPPIDSYNTTGDSAEQCKGEITFQNVSFNYPTRPDIPILKSLSLRIHPGTSVAFVGPSGSGKSTTVSLVQRLYDPLTGMIQLDGKDLKSFNIKSLRQQIGVVSQEPVLFNTTISQNVMLGAANAPVTQPQVEEACKLANCHDFIMKLPKGYDTNVGEHGGMMSGGQKQRIAIARALVRNPKILLLDEATSALDTTSERMVQAAIDKATKNRTTIIVAHRLSTIRNADLIVVMDKGVLVEKGTHDELLKLGGIYCEMVKKQKIKTAETNAATGATDDVTALRSPAGLNDKANEAEKQEINDLLNKESNEAHEMKAIKPVNLVPTVGLTLEEEENAVRTPYTRVLALMKPDFHLLCLGVFGALVGGCVFPVFSFVLSNTISILVTPNKADIAPGPFRGANLYAFLFVVLGIGAFLSIGAQMWSFEVAGARMARRTRLLVFASLVRQEVSYFDRETNSLGALTSRLALDAANVGEMVTKVWGDVTQLFATALCGLVIAFSHSWQLTLIVLCVAPFMIASSSYESRIRRGFEDITKKAYEKTGEVAAEAMKSIRTVAALSQEAYFTNLFDVALEVPHKMGLEKAYKSSIGHGATQGFTQFANAIGFYGGIRLMADGKTNFSDMFITIMAIMMTAQGLGRSSTFMPTLAKARVSAITTFALIDRATEIDPDAPGDVYESFEGNFEFKDIAFTYPSRPQQPIFTGQFALTGKHRQTIALVGPSGCGKSTTIGMLERWYNPLAGTLTVDGRNIKSYQLNKGLRANMALVGQEPVLFDMTIRENILAGSDRDNIPEAELDEVSRMANIYTFIHSLPLAYDTRVGDKGSQLSGGQKQRIAIARALIRKPKLLLLDEATSALDSESEALVQKAIDLAVMGRTTVTIAHRLSTIQNADAIAVVKDGRVIELGTHFELLALKGVYADLVNQQNLSTH